MAITDQIGSAISKGRDAIGATASILNLPGVPSNIRDAVSTLFNSNIGVLPSSNRKDLNNLISTVSKIGGFTRPVNFYVEIAPPPMLRTELDSTRTLAFLSESANLPGVSLATSDIRRYGLGPIERKPYAPIFVDTTMTFLVDSSGIVQRFFYRWMNGIVKFDSMPWGPPTSYQYSNVIDPFEVNYKEQYKTDILVTTVNETGSEILNIRFFEAYPIFMGDVNLSWNDTDSISRLPITFTYFNWKIEDRIPLTQIPLKNATSALQSIIRAGTAIQTIASLRRPTGVADAINVVNNAKIALSSL